MEDSSSLQWVSQLWGDRRCEAAHIVPLGSCETGPELVMEALLKILLPPVQAAYVAHDIRSEEQKTALPRLTHLRFQDNLRRVLLNTIVGTQLVLIAEKGPGCVKHCTSLRRISANKFVGVEISHCPKAQAIQGYDNGDAFLLVDLTGNKRAHLLSLPSVARSANGLVLEERCWKALLEKHRDAIVAPPPPPPQAQPPPPPAQPSKALPSRSQQVVAPCGDVTTRVLLERARETLAKLECASAH